MSDDQSARPAAEPNLATEPLPATTHMPDTDPEAQAEAEATPPSGPARTPGRASAFVRTHVVTLALAVLLVGAIVWGVLGTVSANDWEARATSLSSDLGSTEERLADAEATIDQLETATSRAESTATACVGAIDDADAMLEVSGELDEKALVFMEGLNDFIAAVNAGDAAAVETISAEMDELAVQIENLSAEVNEHVDDYGDSAEGCHVDDAQNV